MESLIWKGFFVFWGFFYLLVNSAMCAKRPATNQNKKKSPLLPPWSCSSARACPLLSYTLYVLQGAFVKGD